MQLDPDSAPDALDSHHDFHIFLTQLIQLLALSSTLIYLSISTTLSQLTIPLLLSLPSSSYFLHKQTSILLRRSRVRLAPLVLVACISWLYLANEAYALAQPVYICLYPVRGDYHHHPQESQLKVQWKLYLVAAVLACGILPWVLGMMRWVYMCVQRRAAAVKKRDLGAEGRRAETDNVTKEDMSNGAAREFEEGLTHRELVARWRILNYVSEILMLSSGLVGLSACLVLSLESRQRVWYI